MQQESLYAPVSVPKCSCRMTCRIPPHEASLKPVGLKAKGTVSPAQPIQ